MDVHHHGHVHHEKKWKEYLFQFFMLFLAVFCGTLAEYQLEHVVEHNKEKQYIKSFIANIKSDTADLRRYIRLGKKIEKWADSLSIVAKTDINLEQNKREFYKYSSLTLSNIPLFNTNDATSAQLRYSGGYRLIQKKGVADSLITYDQINKTVLLQAGYYTQYFNQLNSIWQESLDLTIRSDTSYFANGRLTDKPLPTIQMEEKTKRTFNNKLLYFSGVVKNYDLMLQTLSDYAVRLLAHLQEQYELEDND